MQAKRWTSPTLPAFFVYLIVILSICSTIWTPWVVGGDVDGGAWEENNNNNNEGLVTTSRFLQATDNDPASILAAQIAERTSSSSLETNGKRNKRNKKDGNNSKLEGKKKRKRKDKKMNPERQALNYWANYLTDQDYNYTQWRIMFHSHSAADIFNGYGRKISNVFKRFEAKVNFAMVGACDGTGDNTIKHLYLPNPHWRGVFVEPMSINVHDLITFMAKQNAAHRSLIIRAAATSECLNDTLTVERPLYEEKNKTIPHWLRRQIGSVLPANRKHARKEWTLETVRCVTAKDILADWAAGSASSANNGLTTTTTTTTATSNNNEITKVVASTQALVKKTKLRRPHILKIDVEGHDFDVLMGFLRHDTPVNELPLIIDFEAKSIAKKYPLAKERMEYLGYVVSPFGQDGFALLKADRIKEGLVHEDQYFPPEEEPDI